MKNLFEEVLKDDKINIATEDIFLNDEEKNKTIPQVPLKGMEDNVTVNPLVYLKINNDTKKHWCFLDDIISETEFFQELIILLNSMEADEELIIDINSFGGDISLMNMICSAIFRCKGKVITNILSFAYSAGSAIWSCGHELRISPHAHALYHMGITSTSGRIDDVAIQASVIYKFLIKLFNYFVNRGLLTSEEFDMITLKKIDVILSHSELSERIKIANKQKRSMTLDIIEEEPANE